MSLFLSMHAGTNLVYEGMLLANNSLVVRGDVGEGENGITCTSESADCCSDPDTSGWFSPTGDPLHEGADGASDLYLTRGPGSVRLNRITGGTSALYWCDIPDSSGELQRFYVGLYTGGLASGTPATSLFLGSYIHHQHDTYPEINSTCSWQVHILQLKCRLSWKRK